MPKHLSPIVLPLALICAQPLSAQTEAPPAEDTITEAPRADDTIMELRPSRTITATSSWAAAV